MVIALKIFSPLILLARIYIPVYPCEHYPRFPEHFSWCRDVAAITTLQLPSTKPELKFRAGSNPARGVLEICNGENF